MDTLPPHNHEAERAVLGAMLRNNAVIDDVLLVVSADDFYTDTHQKIFAAVVALHGAAKPADLVTLADTLKVRGQVEDLGNRAYAYLAVLWDAAPSSGNAVYYANLVKEKSTLRRLAMVGGCIVTEARSPTGTAADALEMAQREVFALAESDIAGEEADAPTAVAEVFDHIDACHERRGNAGGISTGFPDLDTILGGLHGCSLVLFAARPSIGKTSLAAAIALTLVLGGHPVFFSSLEQTRLELMERMMCSLARVDSHALRKGVLNDEEKRRMAKAGDEIRQHLLRINDNGCQTVLRIAANARRMKRQQGLAALFIDYLQLIDPSDRRTKRYEQVGEIIPGLKGLAKELAVPVVALCQLNRSPEERTNQRPRLSDLRVVSP